MKTLDEVIKALELCLDNQIKCNHCPYHEEGCPESRKADALHYLKDYRMLVNDIAEKRQELEDEKARYQEAVKNCEEAENKYRQLAQNLGEVGNEPLKWRELRKMEGKPLWVELLKGKWKGWDVIGGFDEDDFGVAMVTVRGDDYYKADLGKTWQAYRKERE